MVTSEFDDAGVTPDAPIQEKPKLKQQRTAPAQTAPQEAFIYIGPNLPGGLLSRFRIFRGGIPEYLESTLREQPKIERLIVPVSGLSEALARTSTPGTIEYAAAQDVLRERKGES
ncbi:hypothetical protein [Paenibacillus tyrfis]|uniref:hypothetical protein n=1 Tax=Paenibacillus tyrfis TaxID=1501230 RepID=UPI00068FB270|nr:hypothetical protein [Paenibacillus tyrfis]